MGKDTDVGSFVKIQNWVWGLGARLGVVGGPGWELRNELKPDMKKEGGAGI